MVRDEIKKILEDIVQEILQIKNVELLEETSLYDLGIDSLDKIEIWMSLEEKFQRDIPEDKIKKCQTVRDLIDLLETR